MKELLNLTDLEIVARTLYGEARGELRIPNVGERGYMGIANVISNRYVAQSWYGKTVRDVCLKPYQFSCWNRDDVNFSRICRPFIDDPAYKIAKRIASMMFDYTLPDITNGANHYHAASMPMRPRWAHTKTPVCTIGGHVFYKL
jgi:N-acetylmuramoyl-L-alanine amidase